MFIEIPIAFLCGSSASTWNSRFASVTVSQRKLWLDIDDYLPFVLFVYAFCWGFRQINRLSRKKKGRIKKRGITKKVFFF
ncbi:hypothetical protein RIR_jg14247.t1 [Rhizophagus irregularis DAOM 181602=DAOM 197198]|nr:hypothetical protein RIR_jg14247.t1 [Rhizophagus irregularis DAOM 181602=DAOM 197198]